MVNKKQTPKPQTSINFPPVVALVGHVDHGKTTLLDAIRKSNIAQREVGGITQKIGASTIEILHEGKKRRITFIDTPGHEAFSKMRSRGAKAADIGLLIVSSTDGIMPQTKESIKALLDAKIPFIVVITKIDLPEKNVEKLKQQILKEGIMLEGLGGDVPFIEVSAKTNYNIKELLELIILVFDLHHEIFSDRSKDAALEGIVIESRLDQKAGPRSTVIIKNGTIHFRDTIVASDVAGKVRTLITDQKKYVQSATVGEAVEVLGFEQVPKVGSTVTLKDQNLQSNAPAAVSEATADVNKSFSFHHDTSTLSAVIIADTYGSLEAILAALPKEIIVTLSKTGDISPSDVFLAKSTKSLIVGFNTPIKPQIIQLARTEKVLMKNYILIYELLDELQDVMEGKALALQEEVFGQAKVLASFPFEKTKVLGIVVLEGRAAKGDKVRLMRGDEVLGESTIISLRQQKNQISRIEKGAEGGVIISPFLDFTLGDVLIFHR